MSTNFSLAAGGLPLTLFYQLLLEPPAKAYCLWWGTLRARRQLERQTREPGLSPPTQHILRDINWLTEFVMGSKREPTGPRPLAGAPLQTSRGSSVGLPAQERRDLQLVFLRDVMHSSLPSERIKGLVSRPFGIFRDRL